ncbi:Uu.00g084060.m01.CDS01 [Anthostomella pinea]|uniref:Uu.00g084060.m01.CDS01 n=1 Tax=Anthostomella pinea TaxID=933095 RepID=A0AAI8VLN9_9PEZI|nr:Uu.00g084060.m01.CDS01 [Anthostomella pinea]
MEALSKKSIRSSRGFTYTYYVSDPDTIAKNAPTLLLQHGFPDDAHIWQTDPSAYGMSAHTRDLTEVLDAEGVDTVVSTPSYPWATIGAPPSPNACMPIIPSGKPSGIRCSHIRSSLITDEAPAILKAHADRVYDGMHGAPPDWMLQLLCRCGKWKEWLLDESGDSNVEVRDYAKDAKLKRAFVERFQRDGFEGPVCDYKANN